MVKWLAQHWSQYVNNLNQKGIPLPMVRDPRTGLGSVSLTFMWLSGTTVLAGLIGKISKLLGDVDLTQALWFFGISASLYYGRKFQRGADGSISMGELVDQNKKEEEKK